MNYNRDRSLMDDPLLRKNLSREDDTKESYRKYVKYVLDDTYYMVCIKKCINDFKSSLSSTEKVCLAKCIDRAHDYLVLTSDKMNPYEKKKFDK